jgi:hypothetical protein
MGVFELLLGGPKQIVKARLGELTLLDLGPVDGKRPWVRAVETSVKFAPEVGVPPLVTTMRFPPASHGVPHVCLPHNA